MDSTLRQLMNHFEKRPIDAYNWACDLLALGHDAALFDEMIRLGTIDSIANEKIVELLTIIGRVDLLNHSIFRREFEAELIHSYFSGEIGGWSLIQQCYDLYCGGADQDSCRFWSAVADDADQHGGQFSIEFRFDKGDFDEVLCEAILRHNRLQVRPNKALDELSH